MLWRETSRRVTPGFPVTISQPGSYRLSGNLTVPDADTDAIDITSDGVTLDLNGFRIIGTRQSGTGIGISAFGRSGTKILNGGVSGMGSTGVLSSGGIADGSVVEKVFAENNGGTGIVGDVVVDSVAIGNAASGISAGIARGCSAKENGLDGIDVAGIASGNAATNNGRNGIFALCPSVVEGNVTLGNRNQGIFLDPPVSACAVGNNAGQ